MTTFAHTYKNAAEAEKNFKIDPDARFTLVFHGADGSVATIDSFEDPMLAEEAWASLYAMSSVVDYYDSCDVYFYGGHYGTAEWMETNKGSFFNSHQVVFSETW